MTQIKQVLALGFFDGVHLGHAALLRACRDLADRLGTAAGALTFDHHPKALTDGAAPGLINTLPDRVRQGVDQSWAWTGYWCCPSTGP